MATCAEVLAQTLKDGGITRMYGLPGGEILDFVEAARKVGIEFLLTRHEATASLMADATGQMQRRPGVCVSTLGPGAVNMTLGVANAFLDRAPMIAITAATAAAAQPYATHQNLDLNAVYRPFTKMSITLNGEDTAAKVRQAFCCTLEPRMGPVHIGLPSDVSREPDRQHTDPLSVALMPKPIAPAATEAIDRMVQQLHRAQRPVVLLGLDLNPETDVEAVRRFVEAFGAPVFVTPKAKGLLPEDHPQFFGVCCGVSGDGVIVDFLSTADLLVGVGFEPVESDKLWHQSLPIVSIGPLSIAAGEFKPAVELVGEVRSSLDALAGISWLQTGWSESSLTGFQATLADVLTPPEQLDHGLSPVEVTRCLRQVSAVDTILTTDVGSIKFVTTQVWTTFAPFSFFESNGLSSMSYAFPAAMAATLQYPDRPVLCTIGDGGFGMTLGDVETCVREKLHFVTVVFNDQSLSLIQIAQARRGLTERGVRYGSVDFAAAAAALGAWSQRVTSLEELAEAVHAGRMSNRPAVIDVPIDPREYQVHAAPPKMV